MPLYIDPDDPTLPENILSRPFDERLVFVRTNNSYFNSLQQQGFTQPDLDTISYDNGVNSADNFRDCLPPFIT